MNFPADVARATGHDTAAHSPVPNYRKHSEYARDVERQDWMKAQAAIYAMEAISEFELAAAVKFDMVWMLSSHHKF